MGQAEAEEVGVRTAAQEAAAKRSTKAPALIAEQNGPGVFGAQQQRVARGVGIGAERRDQDLCGGVEVRALHAQMIADAAAKVELGSVRQGLVEVDVLRIVAVAGDLVAVDAVEVGGDGFPAAAQLLLKAGVVGVRLLRLEVGVGIDAVAGEAEGLLEAGLLDGLAEAAFEPQVAPQALSAMDEICERGARHHAISEAVVVHVARAGDGRQTAQPDELLGIGGVVQAQSVVEAGERCVSNVAVLVFELIAEAGPGAALLQHLGVVTQAEAVDVGIGVVGAVGVVELVGIEAGIGVVPLVIVVIDGQIVLPVGGRHQGPCERSQKVVLVGIGVGGGRNAEARKLLARYAGAGEVVAHTQAKRVVGRNLQAEVYTLR